MKIEQVFNDGKEYINVLADKSSSKGILHFGHEILVTFVREDRSLIFESAWHCGVSEVEWNSSEKSSFEDTFPGLLAEMRSEISAA